MYDVCMYDAESLYYERVQFLCGYKQKAHQHMVPSPFGIFFFNIAQSFFAMIRMYKQVTCTDRFVLSKFFENLTTYRKH